MKKVNAFQGNCSAIAQNDWVAVPQKSALNAIAVVTGIIFLTVILVLLAPSVCTVEQMYIVRPMLAACSIFAIFCYLLQVRIRVNIFGEIGFMYLLLASAYTILPAISFLSVDFISPSTYEGLNVSSLLPERSVLGVHIWRHVLFMFGVAGGYLAVRGREISKHLNDSRKSGNRVIIVALLAIIGGCILAMSSFSAPVTSYIEHYTRYDHLSWLQLRIVFVCGILKNGGYFVLMALMFSQYRRYRLLIFIVVPILCVYESVYSFGSRIETLSILLAFVGFYHYRVNPISIRKGVVYLFALAVLFSGMELFRSSNYSLENTQKALAKEGGKQAGEFGAVFYTSFHLYAERAQGTLPPREWQMFLNDFIALIPFVDHTTNHPLFWYARNYFPNAVVPPQTMGVLADSAIWGGEIDLFVRSLMNGAIFALLMRWFLRNQDKWWVLTIYVYCFATCIMPLKYSFLYHLTPIVRIILPTLVFTGILFRIQKALARFKSVSVAVDVDT